LKRRIEREKGINNYEEISIPREMEKEKELKRYTGWEKERGIRERKKSERKGDIVWVFFIGGPMRNLRETQNLNTWVSK